ncbi:LysR family transcriptional regulator [Ligilactobacillus salitolerans]|uniref:LysR family transcriptional regulator n=1 Tax=Ligilactobacillus salitolerans TaxID=1808352 RepID=A0A401ISB0_9LACO|nr:LysR family transcriptional regulator [Ligilactobacillus salitolerans]GBG94411.1 LysR family transcriptional regulator [Ligilactobacillus salitolerans]
MTTKDPGLLLQYLDTLLRYGNFTKAAQELFISQPYLTQLIKRKEDELGAVIINRHSTHLKLTEAGKLYYQYLENISRENAEFKQRLTQYNSKEQITLRLGVLSSLGTFILPLFLPFFTQLHPNVQVILEEDIPEKSEKKVQNGDIDFYLGQTPETVSPNLNVVTAGYEPYYVVLPEGSNFYDRRFKLLEPNSLPLAEILAEPLVLSKTGSAIRHQVDGLLHKNKVEPQIVFESENIEIIAGLAAYGMGSTIIPQSIVDRLSAGKFNLYPLSKTDLILKHFIAYPAAKKLSPLEQELVESFSSIAERTSQIRQ